MVFKRMLAAVAAAAVMTGSALSFHPPKTFAADDYLIRDYYDISGNQHYIDKYNSATSEHFQIIWGNDDQTGLVTRKFIRLNLNQLEKYRTLYTTDLGMADSSESVFAPDGNKYKTNVYLTNTGLPDFESGWAYMNAEPSTGFAYIYIDPTAMVQLDGTDSGSLAHEYGHVLTYHQKSWVDQPIIEPWWESAANWFKEQYFRTLETPTTHFFLPYLRNMNLSIPHGRNYYDTWIFLQYLTENPDNIDGFGQKFMMRLQSEAEPNEYPFDTIQRLTGCDLKEVIGDFAKRMATLDFENKELYNQQLEVSLKDPFVWQLIYTQPSVSPDKENSYIVPAEKAPMQTGLNVIPLNIEGDVVTVDLHGISDAEGADWRACIVAEGEDGVTKYSPLFGEGEGTLELEGTETALYLTVAATPDRIIPNNAYLKEENNSDYAYNGEFKRRYPYEFEIKGASPMYRSITEGVAGHAHVNGGGFVADTAEVDDTVYVGKNAKVLGTSVVKGNAVITDYAVVKNANISGSAKISDYACVYGFWWASPTVSDNAKIGERAVVTAGASISGNARIMGNAYILDNYSVTDNATVKGTAYCYGDGVASGQAILDGEFYNECSVSEGTATGWMESEEFINDLPYTDGLYAGYEFERESRVFAYDTYGATNGIMRNSPLWEETRENAEGVVTFNGKDQYIVCDRSVADYKEMEICTAVFWNGGANEQSIFEFGKDLRMRLTPANKDGVTSFSIGGNSLIASKPLDKGKWSVIRIIIKNSYAKMLINGKLAAESSISYQPEDTVDHLMHCYIARDQAGHYFNGSMDYFRIYYKEGEEPEYYYDKNTDDNTENIAEAKPVSIISEPTLYGDANCDGKVDMADFNLLINAISKPSIYGVDGSSPDRITALGVMNADVHERGNGLSANDALTIRSYIQGTVKELPVSTQKT